MRNYTMALLFLALDMEMVFMYPWAVVFVEEGMIALAEMRTLRNDVKPPRFPLCMNVSRSDRKGWLFVSLTPKPGLAARAWRTLGRRAMKLEDPVLLEHGADRGSPRLWLGVLILLISFGAGFSSRSVMRPGVLQDAGPQLRETAPRADLTADEQATIALFERVGPSVVYVTSLAVRRDSWGRNVIEIPQGTGSGFVWDDRGHIVTNFHVVRDADAVHVSFADQSMWEAQVVGAAPEKDLAVLRIDVPADRLQPIPLGTTADLRVGQKVFAIGNPFGLDHTLTTGVVSAIGREIESVARIPIRDVIQTDAAINPGNSGGPLLDSGGRLIGVNTAIYSPSGAYAGIGFAIPADMVGWAVPDLIAYGEIRRPSMGVQVADAQLERRLQVEGALVLSVVPGGSAERAGIRPTRRDSLGRMDLGDVIVAVDGNPVRSSSDLVLALERRSVGERVSVTVLRGGSREVLDVTLERMR